MLRSLVQHGVAQRSVFYDELSHLNPTYSAPTDDDLWPLEAERRYHLRNLRILSLYFDNIIIMTGNLLNFANYTTREIVLEVISDTTFSGLTECGVIRFCGWGASLNRDMVQNQIDYARTFRSELKDRDIVERVRSILSLSDVLVREESMGEEDFLGAFLERMRIRSERSSHEDWRRVEEMFQSVHAAHGHVGTMEIFPLLKDIEPVIQRRTHEVYLDAWIDYASDRYHPVHTYESPRFRLNPYRTTRSSTKREGVIASILLSPQFFQAFILRFLRKEEYYRLLSLSPRRIMLLRNGDWMVFCEHYHAYLRLCSQLFWRLQILSVTAHSQTIEAMFDEMIRETMRDLPGSLDAAVFTDFLSHAIGFFAAVPGLSALIRSALRPIAGAVNRSAEKIVRRIDTKELYPFIAKVRAAVA